MKAQFIGYLAHGLVRTNNLLFCHIHNLVLDILLSRFPRFFLYKVAKIVRRQTDFIGKIPHRRKSVPLRHVLHEIGIEQDLELGQHIPVRLPCG